MPPSCVLYEADGWGVGELWLDGERLVQHELPAPRPFGAAAESHPLGLMMSAYFRGERIDFSGVELDLEWCTPFQGAVADALRAVLYGETVTYGELAALAGHPNAQRAAGSFCAGNRFPLVLPCHRVVAAGGVGAFGSLGRDYKRRLLELEQGAARGADPQRERPSLARPSETACRHP